MKSEGRGAKAGESERKESEDGEFKGRGLEAGESEGREPKGREYENSESE